jgi:hypothetical protein
MLMLRGSIMRAYEIGDNGFPKQSPAQRLRINTMPPMVVTTSPAMGIRTEFPSSATQLPTETTSDVSNEIVIIPGGGNPVPIQELQKHQVEMTALGDIALGQIVPTNNPDTSA